MGRNQAKRDFSVKLPACEICEESECALFPCDIGAIPRGGLYFCAEHFMEHLREAHGMSVERAMTKLANTQGWQRCE